MFAGEDIEWGRRIIEYQGQPLSLKETKRRQKFYDSIGYTCLIQFSDGLGVDGISGGNEARFINHSTRPNVAAIREDKWRLVFYSLDDIAKGEELTFNYGFDPANVSESSRSTVSVPDAAQTPRAGGPSSERSGRRKLPS